MFGLALHHALSSFRRPLPSVSPLYNCQSSKFRSRTPSPTSTSNYVHTRKLSEQTTCKLVTNELVATEGNSSSQAHQNLLTTAGLTHPPNYYFRVIPFR